MLSIILTLQIIGICVYLSIVCVCVCAYVCMYRSVWCFCDSKSCFSIVDREVRLALSR